MEGGLFLCSFLIATKTQKREEKFSLSRFVTTISGTWGILSQRPIAVACLPPQEAL